MTAPASLYQALGPEYPRWPGESLLHWMQRLNVLAGDLKREDADEIGAGEDLKAMRDEGASRDAWKAHGWNPAAEARLPYRESE